MSGFGPHVLILSRSLFKVHCLQHFRRPLVKFFSSNHFLPVSHYVCCGVWVMGGDRRSQRNYIQFQPHRNFWSKKPSVPEAPPDPNKKLSLFQKFKKMYKDYWYVLIPVHLATSIVIFGSLYHVASSGMDLKPYLEYLEYIGFTEHFIKRITESSAGNIAIAYALFKIITPIRYTITISGTTLAINSLKKLGYIKPASELMQQGLHKLEESVEHHHHHHPEGGKHPEGKHPKLGEAPKAPDTQNTSESEVFPPGEPIDTPRPPKHPDPPPKT